MRSTNSNLRWRELVAASGLLAGASPAFAQSPAEFPLTVPTIAIAPIDPSIEIYYGTAKMPSANVVARPSSVVLASAMSRPTPQQTRSAEAFIEAMNGVRDGSRDISSATVGLLGKVGERLKHTAESHPIIFTTYQLPSIPMPAAQASAAPAAAPQIIVVRESGENRSAPELVRGMTISFEMLIAVGIGLAGIAFAGWAWIRGLNRPQPIPIPVEFEAPIDPNAVRLMGKYNAGPRPESAEKFEIGPSYQDDVKKKKQIEEANSTAAVEFILNQNLDLLAALNPEAGGTIVHTDAEGFAALIDPPEAMPALA